MRQRARAVQALVISQITDKMQIYESPIHQGSYRCRHLHRKEIVYVYVRHDPSMPRPQSFDLIDMNTTDCKRSLYTSEPEPGTETHPKSYIMRTTSALRTHQSALISQSTSTAPLDLQSSSRTCSIPNSEAEPWCDKRTVTGPFRPVIQHSVSHNAKGLEKPTPLKR